MNTWKIRKEEFPMTKIFGLILRKTSLLLPEFYRIIRVSLEDLRKNAAKAFLAKAYLFQQKYSEAKVLLDEVITSGKYKLLDNYFDNFNAEQNNNAEVVWSNQVAVNVAGAGYDRSQRGFDLSYPNAPDQPNLSGAGFQQPTFDLVNAYQVDENGLPMIDTYADHEFKNDQDIESSEAWEPDMETPVDPRLDWVVGRRGVPYHDWGLHPGKAGSGIKSAQVLITKKNGLY